MKIFIKNGHLVDPTQKIDEICDIFIQDGKITEIHAQGAKGKGIGAKGSKEPAAGKFDEIIEASGMIIMPGLVDMHVHLREPGFEYKETIKTGTEAAVRGGITSVCCMPNTNPVNDNPGITEFILRKAILEGSCSVFPIGAITKGQKGEELAELGMMYDAGCVAFSDDGRPVMDSLLMRRALEYSRVRKALIISHAEDMSLAAGGVMNEGLLSITLGLKGIPAQAEEIMIARDIALAELTGGRLHIAHVSTAGSVELLRAAKKRGVAEVTAETCPHYFSITEQAVCGYNANAKVNPPLRSEKDVEAIRMGVHDGTLDVIATDHAPHHKDEKSGEFDNAPSGISGLETSLGLSMRLVDEKVLTLGQLVEKMSLNPARILGLHGDNHSSTLTGIKGTLKPGADGDLVIIDTKTEYTVNAAGFKSKGKNTPFDGWVLKARPVVTVAKGRIYRWE
ncbi:MAG: dihydroorotase [Nitrospirae bacterium]|nr:dihydroorotase [Nitrospirota bacterium]